MAMCPDARTDDKSAFLQCKGICGPSPLSLRMKIVPDTSVIVDGRITELLEEPGFQDAEIVVPEAVVAELESQAQKSRETGVTGLEELASLGELARKHRLKLSFAGRRPTLDEVRLASGGEIDAMIRDLARQEKAVLITSDWVQAKVAEAKGIEVEYLEPIREEKKGALPLLQYFKDDVMSVHLRTGAKPRVKRGKPGRMFIEEVDSRASSERELKSLAKGLVEAARSNPQGFIEMDEGGATVIQLENVRIAIASPPFSDGFEITAVRPVVKVDLEKYRHAEELRSRLNQKHRGILISGAPGTGKSTLAQAMAEYLESVGWIIKTMEKPRDLQVSERITQYTALEGDMARTADYLLLVRPDYTIYDELRKTADFLVFSDMRLAGVGMVGVVHATRGIDAVQRFIGRVDLGMIPQIVDTVIFVDEGEIKKMYDVRFNVKVPSGMKEQDLARPVIEVVDFDSKRAEYEIYTFGEEVVVMPVKESAASNPLWQYAEGGLRRLLSQHMRAEFDVTVDGQNHIVLHVRERDIPRVVGREGSNVMALEKELGLGIEVRPLEERRGRRERRRKHEGVNIEEDRKAVYLKAEKALSGKSVEIVIDDEVLFSGTVGWDGRIKLSRGGEVARRILDARFRGKPIELREVRS